VNSVGFYQVFFVSVAGGLFGDIEFRARAILGVAVPLQVSEEFGYFAYSGFFVCVLLHPEHYVDNVHI
jgi:hypothetical protein